jgi:cytoskeleton protein RodZ
MQEPSERELMGELGTWLQDTREAQDLSLEEVEAQTRIRRRFLQALEEGEYDVLPGEVYVRGFLRNYALYLGLDPQEVRRRYRKDILSHGPQQQLQRESGFRPIDADLAHTSGAISRLVTRIALILLLLVGAIGVGTWYWYGFPLPRLPAWWPPRIDALLPTAFPLQSLSTPVPRMAMSTPMTSSATMTPGTSPSTVRPPPKAAATSAVLPLPTPTSVSTATPTPTPSPLPVFSGGQGIELRVQVIERSWVLVTTDDEVDFQGILEAGVERTWRAEHGIGFRCGNAGGVMITVNGQELGTLGERGQVIDQTWIVEEEQLAIPTPTSP